MTKSEEHILRLMRDTGAPLVVSGVKVERWRAGMPPWDSEKGRYSRLQCGVTPLLSKNRSAYRAEVMGLRVSIHGAWSLMQKRQIVHVRRWRIRGRFRLACTAQELQ